MKRTCDNTSSLERESLILPIEIFNQIVNNILSFADLCNWHLCWRESSMRWRNVKYIESLLQPMYDENKTMFKKTLHSEYLRNAYIISYIQKLVISIPILLDHIPDFRFFLQPKAYIGDRFRQKILNIGRLFDTELEPIIIGPKSKQKTTTPLSIRQRCILMIMANYMRNRHGFELWILGSGDDRYHIDKIETLKNARLESEFYFCIQDYK